MKVLISVATALCSLAPTIAASCLDAAELRGSIIDATSKQPLAARLYIRSADGRYFHAQTAADQGAAIPYRVIRGQSIEVHTSLSAHPFKADLQPGKYTLIAERGKEYFSATVEVDVQKTNNAQVTIPIRRWTNMAEQGWYSGETHVHRKLSELPTLLLAEDLNVAFPLTAWVTDSRETPIANNKNTEQVPAPKLIVVDPTHVIWPVNTEYEIFTVNGKQHTLGAVFILNHREPFKLKAPPVEPIAAEARRQQAMLDLDKHNWPWSMMIVPQMKVDLFELTNNHIWRTDFLFRNWYTEYAADFADIEMVDGNFTERGWIEFGFQNYYALLNCGFEMRPTGGTASGVHPVPLGYGRVYVDVDGDFTYENWVRGLLAGRSFVTTGPMLTIEAKRIADGRVRVVGTAESTDPLESVEIIVNGELASTIDSQPEQTDAGAYRFRFEQTLKLDGSSWVAVRTYARRSNRRISFAHTAPVHFAVADKPLRPTREQRDYLAKRVSDEIERHRGVLPEAVLQEYEESLRVFQQMTIAE